MLKGCYMKVFRVCHKDKWSIGPYRNEAERIWARRDHDIHPLPLQEGLHLPDRNWVCGFVSRKQSNEWFMLTERKILTQMGFELIEFQVESKFVKIGKKQLIFDLSRAGLTQSHPLIRKIS